MADSSACASAVHLTSRCSNPTANASCRIYRFGIADNPARPSLWPQTDPSLSGVAVTFVTEWMYGGRARTEASKRSNMSFLFLSTPVILTLKKYCCCCCCCRKSTPPSCPAELGPPPSPPAPSIPLTRAGGVYTSSPPHADAPDVIPANPGGAAENAGVDALCGRGLAR